MTNDPIQTWLNNAGRYPLLPKTELIRLAKKRDTLEPGSKAYIKIINKICLHNLRLVPTVVRKYLAKRVGYNMSSEVASDLLQQGYLGLRRAAEKFDATKGYTFSTYAHSWIYQAFCRWHNTTDRAIYVPENAMTEVLYVRRNGKRSGSKGGRIGQDILNAATRTMDITSIDRRAGNDDDATPLSELMGEDNRILSNQPVDEQRGERMLRKLMDECGIKRRTQEIVVTYAKRGRMSIVASKLSLSPKHCQNLYQEAIREMKAKVEEKEAAKAVRMEKNNTTSKRN